MFRQMALIVKFGVKLYQYFMPVLQTFDKDPQGQY
jgi:hypothetical protein